MADLPGVRCGATSWCINPATGTPAVCTDRPHVAWQPHVDHRGLVDFAFTPDAVAPPGRPWEHVTPVSFCQACRGALPADFASACSTCGPRMAGGTTVTWIPQVADPEHPTIAELRGGIDLTCFLTGEPLLVEGFEETITPLASDIRMPGETAEQAARRYRVMPPPPAPEPSRPWWRPSWAR